MKKIGFITFCIYFITFGYKTTLFAQENPENPEDIALIDDALENNFYNALQQRAIENYDRAVNAIQKCIDKQPNNPAFYYELGKNHLDLDNIIEAEQAFQKATDLNPQEKWYLHGLYDVYYKNKDYPKAITVVQKLIPFDANLKEDLVSLYVYSNQKEEAIKLLLEMEKTQTLSTTMEYYKLKLLEKQTSISTASNKDEKSLRKAIQLNPKTEQNYVDLMMLYSEQKQEEKAIQVAQQLAKELPNSKWASISLFKFYIEENKGKEAVNELLKVIQNSNVKNSLKHQFLNEFLIFSANAPNYDTELEQAIDLLSEDTSINVAKEVAKFYFNKKNHEKTSFFLEKALTTTPNDWESINLLLNNLANSQQYDELANRSQIFLNLFPAQPQVYLYAGLAQNKLQKPKQAIDFLETGLEFVIENPELELYFHKQLTEAYEQTGNNTKQKYHANQVNKLKK